MIAPGSLAIYTARRAGRRTPTYMRRGAGRRAARRAPRAPTRDTGGVLLSHNYEFPTATLLAKQPPRDALWTGLRAWFAARWQWLRPRTIPVAVAIASMIAALAATSALTDYARQSRVEASPMLGVHAHIVRTTSTGIVFERDR